MKIAKAEESMKEAALVIVQESGVQVIEGDGPLPWLCNSIGGFPIAPMSGALRRRAISSAPSPDSWYTRDALLGELIP